MRLKLLGFCILMLSAVGCKVEKRIEATLALTGDPANGESVYFNLCTECHGIDLNGTPTGPSLLILVPLNEDDEIIRQVIEGGGDMPPYGEKAVDQEIADVLSFVRQEAP